MPTVKEVVGQVASGTGVKGDWTKFKVRLDNGQEVVGFGPVNVGDEVSVTVHETYGPQFKVINKTGATAPANDDISKLLNLIYKNTEEIKAILGADESTVQELIEKIPND